MPPRKTLIPTRYRASLAGLMAVACSEATLEEADTATDTSPTVLISELIADAEAWDGERVAVEGALIDLRDRPQPDCEPEAHEGDPELIEGSYSVWPATWGLADGHLTLGVVVLDDAGAGISTLPDVDEGSPLRLVGEANYGTVSGICDPGVLYESIFLMIEPEAAGL